MKSRVHQKLFPLLLAMLLLMQVMGISVFAEDPALTPATIALSASPIDIARGGTSTITAVVKNNQNQILDNVDLSWSLEPVPNGSIATGTTVADNGLTATVTAGATQTGVFNVRASIGAVSSTVALTVVGTPPSDTTYTITYESTGTGTQASGTATAGIPFALPGMGALSFDVPENHMFAGWALADGTPLGALHEFTAPTTVYAVWVPKPGVVAPGDENNNNGGTEDPGDVQTDPNADTTPEVITVTLTFDANGGGGTQEPITAQANTSVALPYASAPSNPLTLTPPTGMTFNGWSYSKESPPFTGSGYTHSFAESATLYAIWSEIPPFPTETLSANMTVTADRVGAIIGEETVFNFTVKVTDLQGAPYANAEVRSSFGGFEGASYTGTQNVTTQATATTNAEGIAEFQLTVFGNATRGTHAIQFSAHDANNKLIAMPGSSSVVYVVTPAESVYLGEISQIRTDYNAPADQRHSVTLKVQNYEYSISAQYGGISGMPVPAAEGTEVQWSLSGNSSSGTSITNTTSVQGNEGITTAYLSIGSDETAQTITITANYKGATVSKQIPVSTLQTEMSLHTTSDVVAQGGQVDFYGESQLSTRGLSWTLVESIDGVTLEDKSTVLNTLYGTLHVANTVPVGTQITVRMTDTWNNVVSTLTKTVTVVAEADNTSIVSALTGTLDADNSVTPQGSFLQVNTDAAKGKDVKLIDYARAKGLSGTLAFIADITLVDENGNPVEPDGNTRVRINLPGLTPNDTVTIVHEKSDGSIETLPATSYYDYLEFTPTSFSVYGVIVQKNTGGAGASSSAPGGAASASTSSSSSSTSMTSNGTPSTPSTTGTTTALSPQTGASR